MTPHATDKASQRTSITQDIRLLENRILFARCLQDNKISHQARELITSVRYPWHVLNLLKQKLKELIAAIPVSRRIAGDVAAGAVVHGDEVVVEAGARVEDFAVIHSPAYLAAGVVVRSAAYLRSGVWAESGALIGHSTEIKASLLLPEAKAAHQCYVGDCILGQGVNLGAGSKAANLRFDKAPIRISYGGAHLSTERRKLGTIFGDEAQSGCNVVNNPGTIFLPCSKALPCKSVSGVVSKGARFPEPENHSSSVS